MTNAETLLNPCILIVEDDDDLRAILKLMLEHRFGYRVIEAPDGKTAVDLAQQEKPALILMDLVMPKMGGLEALSLIHTNPTTENIPIIVISDHCWNIEVRERSRELGSLHCVDKAQLLEELPKLVPPILKRQMASAIGHSD